MLFILLLLYMSSPPEHMITYAIMEILWKSDFSEISSKSWIFLVLIYDLLITHAYTQKSQWARPSEMNRFFVTDVQNRQLDSRTLDMYSTLHVKYTCIRYYMWKYTCVWCVRVYAFNFLQLFIFKLIIYLSIPKIVRQNKKF